MDTLTIGSLAKEAGVNVETVRYYERRGLILQPDKPSSGYRHYSREEVSRIQFIKHAQDLGFTLKEITELLSLRVSPKTSCEEVKEQAITKIQDIQEKIQTLQSMKRTLEGLVRSCENRAPTSECPILETLNTGEMERAHR